MEKQRSSYWGIDLGGTKIEGVVLPGDFRPEPISRIRIATEANKGYEHIVERIGVLVEQLKDDSGLEPDCIGIGTPGTIDKATQTIKNSNTTCLIGKPFKADLEKRLGLPVRMANDANCFALAECKLGAAAELKPEIAFGVIMGTGVGGGLVAHGKIINGLHGIAGEWGHNFLDESGGPCYCGRSGCVETIISGPALERWYADQAGKSLRLKEIVEAADAGSDPMATATIDRLVTYFGKAIAVMINVVDPEVVILGGGVGNVKALYDRGVNAIRGHLFNPGMNTRFLAPALGDSAGVFGAAMLTAD